MKSLAGTAPRTPLALAFGLALATTTALGCAPEDPSDIIGPTPPTQMTPLPPPAPPAPEEGLSIIDLAASGERLVAVGAGKNEGGTRAFVSSDGLTWSSSVSVGPSLPTGLAVAPALGRFVVVGRAPAAAYVSSDGSHWTPSALPAVPDNGLAFGHGVFVAPIVNAGFLVSTDGESWSIASGPGVPTWAAHGVTFAQDGFAAWGESSQLARSVDGRTWRVVPMVSAGASTWGSRYNVIAMYGTERGFSGVLETTTPCAACFGEIGLTTYDLLRSADGESWQLAGSPKPDSTLPILVSDDRCVAVGVSPGFGKPYVGATCDTLTAVEGITVQVQSAILFHGVYLLGGFGGVIAGQNDGPFARVL